MSNHLRPQLQTSRRKAQRAGLPFPALCSRRNHCRACSLPAQSRSQYWPMAAPVPRSSFPVLLHRPPATGISPRYLTCARSDLPQGLHGRENARLNRAPPPTGQEEERGPRVRDTEGRVGGGPGRRSAHLRRIHPCCRHCQARSLGGLSRAREAGDQVGPEGSAWAGSAKARVAARTAL